MSTKHESEFLPIGSIGRQGLIDRIQTIEGVEHPDVIQGIGDDAAVIEKQEERVTLLTSETYMEGVDFDLMYHPLKHLGYKLMSAAVSDIYAMNGLPTAATVNLALPNKISVQMVEEIYRGLQSAAGENQLQIVGGDISAAHQALTISISVYGEAEEPLITYRSGAHQDDAVCVTGDLGGAMAGLRILMREKKFWQQQQGDDVAFQPDLEGYEYVVGRQLVPKARRDLIEQLRESEIRPSSMIDVTQGLVNELSELIQASETGAYIYQAAIPIAVESRGVADEMKEDVDRYALYGGEDLELLFTLPESQVERFANEFQDFAVIGRITDQTEGLKMQTSDGDVVLFDEENQE
ncbi:MAG: thiamine-phosphate kinase [Bacteroidota bacterium]